MTLLSSILGTSFSQALGATGANTARQQTNTQAYQNYMAGQQQAYRPPQWMIAGRAMSITEFATELFGDTPQRTLFLLKYSGEKK